MTDTTKAVEVYMNSDRGKRHAVNAGDEATREYAAASFVGIYPTPGDFARKVWRSWPVKDRADYIQQYEDATGEGSVCDPAQDEANDDVVSYLVGDMIHGGTVEFTQTPEGFYVFDENSL